MKTSKCNRILHLVSALIVACYLIISVPKLSYANDTDQCDRLAASSTDPLRRAPGNEEIGRSNIADAFKYCRAAYEASSDIVTTYQFGRVIYWVAKYTGGNDHYATAAKIYYQAVKGGHARAAFGLYGVVREYHIDISEEPNLTWRDLSIAALRIAAKAKIVDSVQELAIIGDGLYYGRDRIGYGQNRLLGEALIREAAALGNPTAKLLIDDIAADKLSRAFDFGSGTGGMPDAERRAREQADKLIGRQNDRYMNR